MKESYLQRRDICESTKNISFGFAEKVTKGSYSQSRDICESTKNRELGFAMPALARDVSHYKLKSAITDQPQFPFSFRVRSRLIW